MLAIRSGTNAGVVMWWLKVFWPLPFLFWIIYNLVVVGNSLPRDSSAGPQLLIAMLLVILSFNFLFTQMHIVYEAKRFVRMVNMSGDGRVLHRTMQHCAVNLDAAYARNVRLQRGALLGIAESGDSEKDMKLWAKESNKLEREIKRSIAECKGNFWGVARFLAVWSFYPMPKSYRDCLPKKDEEPAKA